MGRRTTRIIFYSLWLILLLFQARFTQLLPDEAYYWNYSTNLAWGYFDHPPVIAFLIKCGCFIFKNELGVRLLPICLNTLAIFILEKLVKPIDLTLFYMVISSIFLLHVFDMLALPDAPLLFFTVTFFYLYKRLTGEFRLPFAILLGLNMGLLMLSKYHGLLVILFTLLSNIKLLKKPYFWLAIVVALCCVFPHLLWLFRNSFVTISFQLRGREGIDLSYTLEYILTQPFIFGPIMGLILLILTWRFKPANPLESALWYNLVGVYSFFLLMTFKGRVEAHWTLIVLVPLLYIGYKQLETNTQMKKIVYYSFPFSLILFMAIRLFLVWDYLPETSITKDLKADYHGWKNWATALKVHAGNKSVVFMNGYMDASEYEFYAGAPAISLNTMDGRKNQYDIWKYSNNLQGDSVMMIANVWDNGVKTFETAKGKISYMTIGNFRSFSSIEIRQKVTKTVVNKGENIDVTFQLHASTEDMKYIDLDTNKNYPSVISYEFFSGKQYVSITPTELKLSNAMLNNNTDYHVTVKTPASSGTYQLYLSVKTGWLPAMINSDKIVVKVL